MNKKILVVGSVNIDQTIFTNELPSLGKTLHGESFIKGIGGKGANQAVAAHYLGADVSFFGAIGDDDEGRYISSFFERIGLKSVVKTSKLHTGMAFINTYVKTGENQILVVRGANSDVNIRDIDNIDQTIKKSQILLTQLETPVEVVSHLMKKAKEYGLLTILNPAPYHDLPGDIYPYIDYLVPNEHELNELVKEDIPLEDKIGALLNRGVKNVIVTLGEKGSILVNKQESIQVDAHPVKAIDTTAAGDSYLGALVTALSENKDIKQAMEFASKCSSITVTRKGAIASLPKREEIK